MVLQRQVKAHNAAITAFDISPSGLYLGTGTSEGNAHAWHALHSTQLLLCGLSADQLVHLNLCSCCFCLQNKGQLQCAFQVMWVYSPQHAWPPCGAFLLLIWFLSLLWHGPQMRLRSSRCLLMQVPLWHRSNSHQHRRC